jgi:hypothetical protein
MTLELKTYRNSNELANLSGVPIYMSDMMDAALRGRLNVFLQGNTGYGKTQIIKDIMPYFPNKSLFILGRNDLDTRELFKRINLGKLFTKPSYNPEPLVNPDTGEINWIYQIFREGKIENVCLGRDQADRVNRKLNSLMGSTENITEVTDKINVQYIGVDELPNCVPAVRAQLFNMFDGFIEIDGKAYPFGNKFIARYSNGNEETLSSGIAMEKINSMRENGVEISSSAYSVGIATGNIGQQFTESSNELGRALKDRMHVIIDTDYFLPKSVDTLEMLIGDRNPRVHFSEDLESRAVDYRKANEDLQKLEVPFEKYVAALYLVHGLDTLEDGRSKTALKATWHNKIEGHEAGSDAALVSPISPRAAKSVITLSQALDQITKEKGATDLDHIQSMMTAFKFVGAYSGILNDSAVRQVYEEDKYKAMDAVIDTTKLQFDQNKDKIAAGFEMLNKGKKQKKVLDGFTGRWKFMKSLLEDLHEQRRKKGRK